MRRAHLFAPSLLAVAARRRIRDQTHLFPVASCAEHWRCCAVLRLPRQLLAHRASSISNRDRQTVTRPANKKIMTEELACWDSRALSPEVWDRSRLRLFADGRTSAAPASASAGCTTARVEPLMLWKE
ncbi:hypothetical protein OAO87_00905 [bacterium]|nr:hypothetical protein [bacterium]